MNSNALLRPALLRRVRCSAHAALTLLLAFDAPLAARSFHPTAGVHGLSAGYCSRHPELFNVRPLTAVEAARLVRPSSGFPTIGKFDEGTVVSGPCTPFIRTFRNGVILDNDARFGVQNLRFVRIPASPPGTGPVRSLFNPPANILTIDSKGFTEGRALSFVQNFPFGSETELVLWSGRAKSVLGTVRCVGPKQYPCTLGRPMLSSPYRIREFELVPCLHGTTCGSLWFWFTVRPGEEAIARYALDYGSLR